MSLHEQLEEAVYEAKDPAQHRMRRTAHLAWEAGRNIALKTGS